MNVRHGLFAVLGVVVGVLVSGCASVSTSQSASAPGKSRGFLGREKPSVEVNTEKAFAGAKRVVIGEYKVGFLFEKNPRAKAGTGVGGVAKAKTKLLGVSPAERQAIVDAGYASFVAALRREGYEVVDRSALLNYEKFAKTKTYSVPYETDNVSAALGGDVVYHVPSAHGGQARVFMGEPVASVGGFGWSNPSMGATEYAVETGVKVLSVNLVVDYINSQQHGGSYRATAAVRVAQGVSVRPGSNMVFIGGHGGTFSSGVGTMALGQPVYSTEEFAEVVDVTTDADKTMQYTANALTALMGSGTSIIRKYEVRADPAKYRSVASDVVTRAGEAFVETMAGLR